MTNVRTEGIPGPDTYDHNFCNNGVLLLRFWPVKALHLLTKLYKWGRFKGEKVNLTLYDRGRDLDIEQVSARIHFLASARTFLSLFLFRNHWGILKVVGSFVTRNNRSTSSCHSPNVTRASPRGLAAGLEFSYRSTFNVQKTQRQISVNSARYTLFN